MIRKLSLADLDKIMSPSISGALRIIKFYSNRCHMCHTLKGIYVKAATQHPDVQFYACNVDGVDDIKELFPAVTGVPTLCKVGTQGSLLPLPDPEPPDGDTWYTLDIIQKFIEQEK